MPADEEATARLRRTANECNFPFVHSPHAPMAASKAGSAQTSTGVGKEAKRQLSEGERSNLAARPENDKKDAEEEEEDEEDARAILARATKKRQDNLVAKGQSRRRTIPRTRLIASRNERGNVSLVSLVRAREKGRRRMSNGGGIIPRQEGTRDKETGCWIETTVKISSSQGDLSLILATAICLAMRRRPIDE